MLISKEDTSKILSGFPSIELSYEKVAHKKVYNSNIVLAIPEGEKCYVWFTKENNKSVCLKMKITNKNIVEIKKMQIKFNYDISHNNGTILYGTSFQYGSTPCFCVEDICYYKNKYVYGKRYDEKINIIYDLLTQSLFQKNNNDFVMGLPVMDKNFYTLLKKIQDLPYNIKTLQFRFFQQNTDIFNMKYFKPNVNKINNNTNKEITKKIFKVVPDIQNDIYHLYKEENNEEVYFDLAFIPNYETSKYMNKLFRNIKENDNLDALEESDDEDEFENEKEDKYVFLDKSYKMLCSYNHKFSKWVPIKVIT